MGGYVTVALRRSTGEEQVALRHTGNIIWHVSNPEFHEEGQLFDKFWSWAKPRKTWPRTRLIPHVVPAEYGLIVLDLMDRVLFSTNHYCSPVNPGFPSYSPHEMWLAGRLLAANAVKRFRTFSLAYTRAVSQPRLGGRKRTPSRRPKRRLSIYRTLPMAKLREAFKHLGITFDELNKAGNIARLSWESFKECYETAVGPDATLLQVETCFPGMQTFHSNDTNILLRYWDKIPGFFEKHGWETPVPLAENLPKGFRINREYLEEPDLLDLATYRESLRALRAEGRSKTWIAECLLESHNKRRELVRFNKFLQSTTRASDTRS